MENLSGTYIIAEAACEHLGNGAKANRLVLAAQAAGADCIKFQHYSERYAKKVGAKLKLPLLDYRFTMEALSNLKDYAKEHGIDFLCSAFDLPSLKGLREIYCKSVKIPSCCNEDKRMQIFAVRNFDLVYASTGMMKKWKFDVYYRRPHYKLLLCTSAYPCPYDQVNLRCLDGVDGLSDHTLGWEVPVAAVAMGAEIIEKHFTLDKMNGGPDAHISLDPREFADMCRRIRNVEMAMGDGIKKIEKDERKLLWRKQL